MLVIDGSFGSGGGQILRTALALSAILQKPFVIKNIRARRPRPGLMPQHLAGVNLAAQLCQAKVKGAQPGSTELEFLPNTIHSVDLTVDVAEARGSAGAVTLVAQAILPIMLFAPHPCKVTLRGGTHVPFSPVFEYLKMVLLPFISKLGYQAEAEITAWGFYPVGGGEIKLHTKPVKKEGLNGIDCLSPGGLKRLNLISRVSRLPLSIAVRQAEHLERLLGKKLTEKQVGEVPARCPGTYLFLNPVYENVSVGFSALGKKGKPAETVADEVYQEFCAYEKSQKALDPHLADQLVLFLALTQKPFSFTTSEVTDHLQTNIWLLNQFLPSNRIELIKNSDGYGLVRNQL